MRGILFDKDGTLIDFDSTWLPVYRTVVLHLADGDQKTATRMLERSGFDARSGRSRSGSIIAAGTTDEMVACWRPDLKGEAFAGAIAQVDEMFIAGALDNLTPITDLAALFTRLKQDGCCLGISTNDVTRSAYACFDHLELTGQLDFITGYDGVARAKPAPDMALAFCAACQIEPKDIVVVGDNIHDLEMGVAAGAGLNVGVLTGGAARDEFGTLADIVLESVADLPDMLAESFPA